MPRRRRRMARPPRTRRPADWVYRPHIRDETGSLIDNLGSYEATIQALPTGQANAQARVLYDSFNYRSAQYPLGNSAVNFAGFGLGPSAKAEGRNPLIRRVEGFVSYTPSTWAVGSSMFWGFRVGIFEQDPITGFLLIDPTYTILNATADTLTNPAIFANTRTWHYEKRVFHTFSENSVRFDTHFRFRVNRLLRPHECYAIFLENHGSISVTTNTMWWCRTLVSDEG